MAISIHKVLSVKNIPGKGIVAKLALTDGVDKKETIISGLPNNQAGAIAAITPRLDELFAEGSPFDDTTVIAVDSPNKTILTEFPSKAAILAFNDTITGGDFLTKQKQFNAKITEAIDALIEIQRGK